MKTIKCLLIVPNPESALNEEAGRLLLERYEDYAKHAKLMTSIHAPANKLLHSTTNNNDNNNKETTSLEPSVSPKKQKSKDTSTTSTTSTAQLKDSSKKVVEKKKSLKRL